jgi:hypothetical protein
VIAHPGQALTVTVSDIDDNTVVRELRDFAIRPMENHEWEGEFKGTEGSARRLVLNFRASLVLSGGVIEGSGLACDFPPDMTEPRDFVVTGAHNTRLIDVDLWFNASFLASTPFVCTGVLSEDERRIAGDFSLVHLAGIGDSVLIGEPSRICHSHPEM